MTLRSFKINVFRIMNDLFFNWDVLITLDLLLNLYHFNLFLRNDFLFVLGDLLNSHILGLNDLSRHCLHNSPFFHPGFFLLYGHFLNNLLVLILNNLFLIGYVVNSTLSYIKMLIPLTTYSFLTCDEENVLVSVLTLDPVLAAFPELLK